MVFKKGVKGQEPRHATPHSKESREKMRKSALKAWKSKELRQKQTESHKNAWKNEETRKRMMVRKYGKGVNASNWKNGKVNHNGYIRIYCPNHPNQINSYVFEHRLIMEIKIKRYLEKNEVVHHLNGIKNDNIIENLVLLSKKMHDYISVIERYGRKVKERVTKRI